MESEMENEVMQMEEQKRQTERERTEVDLFVEQCSSLYNLILDALHDLSNTEDPLQCSLLDEMTSRLETAGARLSINQPETEGVVQLRMHTINSAMEQLRLRRNNTDTESLGSRGSVSSEFRSWLQSVERRLFEHEERLRMTTSLTKLMADQQVLQLEIQSEGQIYISRLEQNFLKSDVVSSESSHLSDRRRVFFESTRKRWHALYLNSLSLQIRIEERTHRYTDSCESDCDSDFAAPPNKRQRCDSVPVCCEDSEEEDTLPFEATEYESIMEGRTTATSDITSSDLENPVSPVVSRPLEVSKWDSVQQDIGYSSGENSVHEALHQAGISSEEDDMKRRERIDCSPVKSFYRTVPLDTDASDCELVKARNEKISLPVENNVLSDSMIVNYESMNNTGNGEEYDEVLRLLQDEDNLLPSDGMNDSFHTQWREIRGNGGTQRRQRNSREFEHMHKASCDASSEDSSDWDAMNNEHNHGVTVDSPMSRSLTSHFPCETPIMGSLKRGRSQKGLKNNSNLLLDCSGMESSFCSTRSEMIDGKNNRGIRKRLKVRRLPRSMSDGEQLGYGTSTLTSTPHIKLSPPRTPLARSTRLLQRLDSALLSHESDTAHEQSDVPSYEWDDYKPPAKDESFECGAMASAQNVDHLLSIDEDYNKHFGGAHQTLSRLINESRANLLIVAKSLEGVDDSRVLRDIELIARTNIRQLETAIKINGAGHIEDIDELSLIHNQWIDLLERASSPVPQIISKFEKFTSTLRSLDQASSMHSLNCFSSISSREDVSRALSSMLLIQENLASDRDELRSLLSSPVFKEVMGEHSDEFEAISDDFDEAVGKIGGVVCSLRQLNSDWLSWSTEQQRVRDAMKGIEDALRSSSVDHPRIINEIEHCQERMNSLETMCNYLTSSILSLQEGEQQTQMPDLSAELRIYANALEQLKTKFTDLTRIPSPIPTVTSINDVSKSESSPIRSLSTVCQSTQSDMVPEPSKPLPSIPKKSNRLQLLGLLGAVVFAFTAFFMSYIYGFSFGPHLSYVRGPPPV